MSGAVVIPFPRRAPWRVELLRERDGAWLVRFRSFGWLHGSLAAALAHAQWLATNHGVTPKNADAARPKKNAREDLDDEV